MKTFLQAAQEHQSRTTGSKATMRQHAWLLDRMAPMHDVPIANLKPPHLFKVMQASVTQGQFEAAKRMKMLAGRVMRYALATGDREEPDFTPGLARVLKREIPVKNNVAVTDPTEVGALLAAIDALDPSVSGRQALRLAAHVFVRPAELRSAEWKEINLEAAEWVIPAHKTKMRRPHVVPLSSFVLAELTAMQARAVSRWVFQGRGVGHISQNVLRDGLALAGYGPDRHTPHGFRSTASTLLNDLGQDPEVIELQLAHVKGKRGVARIYDRSQRLAERRALMEFWSQQLVKWQGLVTSAKEGWE